MQRALFERRLQAERERRAAVASAAVVSTGVAPPTAAQSAEYAERVAARAAEWRASQAADAAQRCESISHASGALRHSEAQRSSSQEGQHVTTGAALTFDAICDDGRKRATSLMRFVRAARTVVLRCAPLCTAQPVRSKRLVTV